MEQLVGALVALALLFGGYTLGCNTAQDPAEIYYDGVFDGWQTCAYHGQEIEEPIVELKPDGTVLIYDNTTMKAYLMIKYTYQGGEYN